MGSSGAGIIYDAAVVSPPLRNRIGALRSSTRSCAQTCALYSKVSRRQRFCCTAEALPVPGGQAQSLAEWIPHVRLVELDGDDHEWFAGNTDRVLDEIRRVATAPFGQMVSLDLLLTTAYR
jgi:hypothetical protein